MESIMNNSNNKNAPEEIYNECDENDMILEYTDDLKLKADWICLCFDAGEEKYNKSNELPSFSDEVCETHKVDEIYNPYNPYEVPEFILKSPYFGYIATKWTADSRRTELIHRLLGNLPKYNLSLKKEEKIICSRPACGAERDMGHSCWKCGAGKDEIKNG